MVSVCLVNTIEDCGTSMEEMPEKDWASQYTIWQIDDEEFTPWDPDLCSLWVDPEEEV